MLKVYKLSLPKDSKANLKFKEKHNFMALIAGLLKY